jgi:hypothetical protein
VSLRIDTNRVTHVLLPDGWYTADANTFDVDAYEFIEGDDNNIVHGGGKGGITSAGFEFKQEGVRISGPLTSVLAVKESAR